MLVGPPGAGKSTIGRKLARELGVDLYDTDAGIEELTGRTIPEIFAEDGEPEFRRIEEEVVRAAVLAEHGVISLGGGSVLSAATREVLRGRTVIYLEISVGEGLRRTGASTNRPLLVGDDPAKKYRELMKIRRPLYREVATIRVRTDGRSPGRVVRMVLERLGVEPTERPAEKPTTPTATPTPSSRSRSRRRRRRGRGTGEAQPATTTTSTATVADSPSESTATEAGTQSGTAVAGTAETPKRGRRNRRSRRRTGDGTAAAGTTAAATVTGIQADQPTGSDADTNPGQPRKASAVGTGPTSGRATTASGHVTPDSDAHRGHPDANNTPTTPPAHTRGRGPRRATRSAGPAVTNAGSAQPNSRTTPDDAAELGTSERRTDGTTAHTGTAGAHTTAVDPDTRERTAGHAVAAVPDSGSSYVDSSRTTANSSPGEANPARSDTPSGTDSPTDTDTPSPGRSRRARRRARTESAANSRHDEETAPAGRTARSGPNAAGASHSPRGDANSSRTDANSSPGEANPAGSDTSSGTDSSDATDTPSPGRSRRARARRARARRLRAGQGEQSTPGDPQRSAQPAREESEPY
ncbi:hypothetical protein HLB23_17245 [Nocardia uniformis]|uniref:Shikimate kinase n=1 Tax=Nocardia uniformis TaxID=53432 RepID=A0A849BYK4_9NOCA|nr:hypothetical protein [Nocardia uniformis]